MKKTIFTLVVLFLISSMSVLQAQNVKDIVAKHLKAIGQDKLEKVESYVIKAKVNQMGMEIPMVMKMKKPDKFRMDLEIEGMGKMVQAFNGEKGWTIAPGMGAGPQDLVGAELEQAMAQADIGGELNNYEQKGNKVELIGKETIDGKETFNLKLTNKEGSIQNYYLDAKSYLILQVKAKVSQMGQEMNVTQKTSEYKDFDGIKIATKITSETPMGDININMEEVLFNQKIDDAIFERPSN